VVGELTIRAAEPSDAARIAAIYNEGIAGRGATFVTREHSAEECAAWLDGDDLLLVAEADGDVVAWAKVSSYADTCVYDGVGEYTIYVDASVRGGGVGRRLLDALSGEAERRGLYKLVGKLFTTNGPSLALAERCGFTEVGVHRRHGRLDGEWKDVVVVERLLGVAATRRGGAARRAGA
jgi:phosphinothricin acetyltransferase